MLVKIKNELYPNSYLAFKPVKNSQLFNIFLYPEKGKGAIGVWQTTRDNILQVLYHRRNWIRALTREENCSKLIKGKMSPKTKIKLIRMGYHKRKKRRNISLNI